MNILQSIQGLREAEQAMLQTVINIFLQSTLLLSLALLAVLMLRRARPTLQAMVCRAALAGTVVIVAASLLVGGQIKPTFKLAAPVQSSAVESAQPSLDIEAKSEVLPESAMSQVAVSLENVKIPHAPPVAEATAPATHKETNPYAVLGIIWIGGSLLLLSWLALCHAHVLRIRKGSTALRDGNAFQLLQELSASLKVQPPLLLVNPKVSSPFLTGLWRPAILLPDTYDAEFDQPAMRAVLIHELAHLQRHDCRWNLLARVSCVLLWPQPLLWMLCRRMEHIAEDVCDQIVVQDGCSPQQYANCLLNLAERLTLRPVERTVGAGVLPVRSALGRRVQQILDNSRRGTMRLSPRVRALAGLAMFSVIAVITMLVTVQVAPGNAPAINAQVLWQGTYSQPVQAVAFAPDSRTLASGSWDHKVRLTDARTGRVLRVLSGHRDRVLSVAFSPTASLLASGSKDRTIKLWNRATGRLRNTLSSEGSVNALAFSPDGWLLASGSRNVRLWDARTGRLKMTLPIRSNPVLNLTFSPDGKTLAAGTEFRTVYLWDVRTGDLLQNEKAVVKSRRALSGHSTNVTGVVFAPDGKSLITGCWDGKGRLWDARTGALKLTFQLSPPDRGITALALSPDGSTLVSGSWDVRLWDGQNLQPKRALPGQHPWVKSLAFSPDGTLLASGSWDKTVKVWRIRSGSSYEVSPPLMLHSPESTVRSFVAALNEGNFKEAAAYVSGTNPGALTSSQEQKLKQLQWRFWISTLKTSIQNGSAKASLTMTAQGQADSLQGRRGIATMKLEGMKETLSLIREGDSWRISAKLRNWMVSPKTKTASSTDVFGLNLFASYFFKPNSDFSTRNMSFVAEGNISVSSPQPAPTPQPSPMPHTTASIIGRVIYEDGSPLRGFEVTTSPYDATKFRSRLSHMVKYSQQLVVRSTTAADGSYRLSGLVPAMYGLHIGEGRLFIGTKGLRSHSIMSGQGVKTQMGKTTHARDIVVLKRSATITGQVVDKVTGKPLAGVLISERGPLLSGSPVSLDQSLALTDKAGRYTLRVAPGTSRFGLGFRANRVSAGPRKNIEITTANGDIYADKVEVITDGGQPRVATGAGVQIEIHKGQTRTVTFRLREIK